MKKNQATNHRKQILTIIVILSVIILIMTCLFFL